MTWKDSVIKGLERIRVDLRAVGADTAVESPADGSATAGLETVFYPMDEHNFAISCLLNDESAQVSFDGWHEQFTSADPPSAVIKLIAFGLSDRCMLKILLAGGRPYRWQMWTHDETEWQLHSETGLLFFNWFGRRRVVERRNALWPWDETRWEDGAPWLCPSP